MSDLGDLPIAYPPARDDNGKLTGGRELGLLGTEGISSPLPELDVL